MYNKYFTMKRSELKEAIKNEITSVLLEGMSDEKIEQHIQHLMRTGAKEKPLRKLAAIGKKEDEKEKLKEGKRGVVVDPDEIMMHINQYQSGNIDGDDLAQAIEEILVAMMSTPLREEDEMSDDEMDKKASRGAKKEPIGKEAERLAQVQKFMRQMQDKGIVGKDKKILDTPKYKEEFAKFKAGLKK